MGEEYMTYGWVDGWMGGWMDEKIGGWVDGWGLPPSFQRITLCFLLKIAFMPTFKMTFDGKLPIFGYCFGISAKGAHVKYKLLKKNPGLENFGPRNPFK